MSDRGFDRLFALRVAIALLAGVASGVYLTHARNYFPRIAILGGLSITVLTYMAIQTGGRLWRIWSRRWSRRR